MPLTQNLHPSRNQQKLRKSPRKARLLVLAQVWLLHPLDLPRNESGSLVDWVDNLVTFTRPRLVDRGVLPIFPWLYPNVLSIFRMFSPWVSCYENGTSNRVVLCE
jgi:hypothetical protein